MRIRPVLAGASVAGALAIGVSANPAVADNGDHSPGKVPAATWHTTTSLGGPIRECYEAACGPVTSTYSGDTLQWSHSAYNEYDHLWYYVRYTSGNGIPQTFYGWIYCANVTAPC